MPVRAGIGRPDCGEWLLERKVQDSAEAVSYVAVGHGPPSVRRQRRVDNRRVRFGILGTTRAWRDDGSEIALGGPRRRALLTLLLADPGKTVSADVLIDELYGSAPPAGVANALQSQVSRLRVSLGHDIEHGPAGYRLPVDPDAVDTFRFELLAAEAYEVANPTASAEILQQALALWRGPALDDAADASSAQAVIARLEERRREVVEDLVEAELALGEHDAKIPELHELVRRFPLRERLRVLLMRALLAAGRQAEALVAFEEARRFLADELGADPSPELAALHLAALQGESPSARPVPAQFTNFFGRTEELSALDDLLSRNRLVTILGTGGAGKTRLAIEGSIRQPHDVCFIELSALSQGADVAPAVLSALRIRGSGMSGGPGDQEVADRVAAALAGRQMLLVFDNCEHVLVAASELVAKLLAAAGSIRVLATSREPLAITGEQLLSVRPLELTAAVELFTDRAVAVRPDFVPEASVSQVCEALDCLPLAIELAAARLRTFDLDEIRDRLSDRFALLSKGSRTADSRHRTLLAVVEWSWELLDARERELARRLSVFADGATRESIAAVCESDDSAEVLASLVDKSLVLKANRRYRMLDTIRAYCVDKLVEAGEGPAVLRAHAQHFLELAETAEPLLRGSQQLEWLPILVAEHKNLLAASRFAIQSKDPETGLRLIAALSGYRWMLGRRAEGGPVAEALLDVVGDRAPSGLEEEYVLCVLNLAPGHPKQVAAMARVEEILPALELPVRCPFIAFVLPRTAIESEFVGAMIARALSGNDQWTKAMSTLYWGFSYFTTGDGRTAASVLERALEGFRALGDRWGMAMTLDAAATVATLENRYDEAISLTDEAIALAEQLGATADVADQICHRGDYRLVADVDGARSDFAVAQAIARRVGALDVEAAALAGLATTYRLSGELEAASGAAAEAWTKCGTGSIDDAVTRTALLIERALIAVALGTPAGAESLVRAAIEETAAVGNLPGTSKAIQALAAVKVGEGDHRRAARLLGAATALPGALPPTHLDVAHTAGAAAGAIGADTYREVFDEGARLTPAEVLTLIGAPRSALGARAVSTLAQAALHDDEQTG